MKRSDDATDKRKDLAKKVTQAEVQFKEAQAETQKHQQSRLESLKFRDQTAAKSQSAVYKYAQLV